MARYWLQLCVVGVFLAGCGGNSEAPQNPQWDALFTDAGMRVDTVGVRNLAQADTTSDYQGLVIIDHQFTFPRNARGSEVFAWEYYAESLDPIKLIMVQVDESGELVEVIGESQMVVPERKGVNRHILREPIPIQFGCMMGLVQPKNAVVPFRVLTGYRTLITSRGFERPLMRRGDFAMYGWRYAMRVFWRKSVEDVP